MAPLSGALAQLVVLEADQVAALADTRAAIAALEKLVGQANDRASARPPLPLSAPRETRAARPAPADVEAGDLARVTKVLAHGPLSVAEFLKKTKLSRYLAQQLVKRGVIVATGSTVGRRFALPGAPAKEAP